MEREIGRVNASLDGPHGVQNFNQNTTFTITGPARRMPYDHPTEKRVQLETAASKFLQAFI